MLHPAQAGDFLSGAKQGVDTMPPHASNRYTRATLEQLAAQAAVEEAKHIVAVHGELTGLRITCKRKLAGPTNSLSSRLPQEASKLVTGAWGQMVFHEAS